MPIALQQVEQAFLAVVAARERGGGTLDKQEVLRLCDGDRDIAAEVQSLLRHLDLVGDSDATGAAGSDPTATTIKQFLNPAELHPWRRDIAAAQPSVLDEWGAAPVGQRIGDYTLIAERGSGGMGVVFIAEQEKPRRTVALKVVRRHAATDEMIRRFDREAQLLARLNHPGIAQVYSAGVAELVTANGTAARVPYIAMELVNGPNLLEFVRARPLDPALVLELLSQVCDAVQHAHVRGVIHRDLKPSNILVSQSADGKPQVKVLDFGVARQVSDQEVAGADAGTQVTFGGQIVGTLSYMSPEQVRADAEVDARTDVYALGAILFQLLADRAPIDVRNCALPEAARRIVEEVPPSLGSIDRSHRGDVETIVATALQKDPARRYQSPAALAMDIGHHLAGEPIQARRDSVMYVLRKQAARYRTIALASGALLLVVALLAAFSWTQHRASERAAQRALASQAKATEAQNESERNASRLAVELSASRIDQGRLLGAAGDLAGAERMLWDEYFARPDRQAAGWALRELYARSGCLRTIAAHQSECRALSLAGDGTRFATGGDEPIVRVWSVPDGRQLAEFDTSLTSVHALCFSHDGAWLAVAGEGGAALIEVATGARRSLVAMPARGIDLAANGLAVAIGTDDGTIRLFEPSSGKSLAILTSDGAGIPTSAAGAASVRGVRFSLSCNQLAAAYADGTVRLWNVTLSPGAAQLMPGPHIAGRPGTTGYGVDFNPDGSLLASGSSDRTLTLWRTRDGQAVTTIETNNGSARSAAFSRDGRLVAIPGFWRTLLFDVATGKPAQPANLPSLGHGGSYAAAFTPDTRLLIATGPEGTCRLWDLIADSTTVLRSTASPVRDLAVERVDDSIVLASIQSDGEVRVRTRPLSDRVNEAAPWRETLRVNAGDRAQTLALSSDGHTLVVGRGDGHLITIARSEGRVVQDLPAHAEGVNVTRISRDGQFLLSGGSDDIAKIYRKGAAGAGWEPAGVLNCGGDVIGAAISPDGKSAVTTARPGMLQFWELPGGRSLGHVSLSEMPWRVAYSPDGALLAAGSWNRSVQIWDVTDIGRKPARLVTTFHGHLQLVLNEAFDATGRLLASVSNDGSLRVWDLSQLAAEASSPHELDRRRCLTTLNAEAGDSLSVAFLPFAESDRLSVAVGYFDGTVRIWDLGYFDRHLNGQIEYQRSLRNLATTAPVLKER